VKKYSNIYRSSSLDRNRKRSVLHFAPDTPVAEKREKIEKLMKKAPSLEKRNDKVLDEKEDRTFSDISDNDFDDFEIAEDFDTEVPLQSRGEFQAVAS